MAPTEAARSRSTAPARRGCAPWAEVLRSAGLPCCPGVVQDLDRCAGHRLLTASPLKPSGPPALIRTAPPLPVQHTGELLVESGHSAAGLAGPYGDWLGGGRQSARLRARDRMRGRRTPGQRSGHPRPAGAGRSLRRPGPGPYAARRRLQLWPRILQLRLGHARVALRGTGGDRRERCRHGECPDRHRGPARPRRRVPPRHRPGHGLPTCLRLRSARRHRGCPARNARRVLEQSGAARLRSPPLAAHRARNGARPALHLFTGRLIDGPEALRFGLATARVVEPGLDEAATALLGSTTAQPAAAIHAAKRSVDAQPPRSRTAAHPHHQAGRRPRQHAGRPRHLSRARPPRRLTCNRTTQADRPGLLVTFRVESRSP